MLIKPEDINNKAGEVIAVVAVATVVEVVVASVEASVVEEEEEMEVHKDHNAAIKMLQFLSVILHTQHK